MCHHTHTLQPMENYRGKPIFYSIGNFIFDRYGEAAIVRLTVTRQQAEAQQINIDIKHCTPYIKAYD